MKLAIVGSTSLDGSEEALRIIEEALDRYAPTIVISGGAKGIDSMAAAAARRRGIPVQEFFPKVRGWALGFKPRNLLIASHCDALVRIAVAGGKTYGSGWTRDRAVEMGKPTEEFVVSKPVIKLPRERVVVDQPVGCNPDRSV